MAEIFRELQGDYVENAGQQINLREYLDYFEPLGSALARLPDGAGGPFIHHFKDGGGRTISALGWVVSAKSKRFGGWKLWGTWTDRAMPPVALPLFWSVLADPARVGDWIERANDDADRLLDADRWSEVLGDLKTNRLRDPAFREILKAELARAYAMPLPHRHPIEIDLTPKTLDLLPWIYLLGPVDPASARLQPNRFSGAGYQYILTDDVPPMSDAEIPREIDSIVDAAAKSIASGWQLANELRARRERPPTRTKPATKPIRPRERNDMRSQPSTPSTSSTTSTTRPPTRLPWSEVLTIVDVAWKLAVLILLAWIAWNVNLIRKGAAKPADPVTSTQETSSSETTTETVAPVYEPDLSSTRIRRIASALNTRAPRGIRVTAGTLTDVNADELARIAVEVFLRRNACHATTESVDGKLSAAEQRSIRNCALLQDQGLMKDRTEPDNARAIQWLEDTLAP